MSQSYLDFDLGNTAIKYQGYGLLCNLSGSYENNQLHELEGVFLKALNCDFFTVRLAAVGADRNFTTIVNILNQHQIPWIRITAEMLVEYVVAAYEDIASLGVDRMLNMIAVSHMYAEGKYIIVSVGTALTIDIMTANIHSGGYILQSPDSQLRSFSKVANLPSLELGGSCSLEPGKNTEACMRSGALLSAVGAIQYICSRYGGYEVILTGGAAKEVSGHLSMTHKVVENLVLKGLSFVLRGTA